MPTTKTTSIALYVSPNAPIIGGIVTLWAKVTPSDSGTPTGSITFSSSSGSGITYGTVPIVDNEARMTVDTSYSYSGYSFSTTFTAAYNGDSTYAGSTVTTSSITFSSNNVISANGVWQANTSTSGAFDYTQQLNYIAAAVQTIAVNSSEIRNYIGDISKSIATVANLASGNGVHTAGAYDWLGAASLYKYYVEEGVAANTSGNASAAVQLAANTALNAYSTSVSTLKKF